MATRRPNFVFFMPDELRADAVHYVDGQPVQTPHMDRLAAEGVVFTHHYTTHTVCSPSRCSLMTGWYPHTRGHRTLQYLLQPDEPNLLKYLKRAGYHVEWHGKNDLLAQESFAESVSARGVARHTGPAAPVQRMMNPWPPGHRHYRSFYYGSRGPGPYQDRDSANVDQAVAFLQQPPSEPFFLYLPLSFPHPPYTVEEPYFSLHDRARVPAPLPPLLDDKPHFMREMHRAYNPRLTEEDFREIRATYFGMVSRSDAQLGWILDVLDRSPLRENTIVVATSDHGDYVGDYGLTEKWWTGFQDCLIRIPLIMRLPEAWAARAGRRVEALCEQTDLFPTLLELAGVEAEHDHFGQSLLPLIQGDRQPFREAVFAEGGNLPHETQGIERLQAPDSIYYEKTRIQNEDPSTVAKAAMVRTVDWKYVRRLQGADELYDLGADPGELRNLAVDLPGARSVANDPELRAVRDELRDALLDWFLRTGDVVPRKLDPRG